MPARFSPRLLRCLPLAALVLGALVLGGCAGGEKEELLAAGAERKDMPWARSPVVTPGQESLDGLWERTDRGWGYRKDTFVTIQDGVLQRVGKDSMELGQVLRGLGLTQGGVVDIYVNDWTKQPGMYGFQWKDGEKEGRFFAYAIIGVVANDKKLYISFTILQRKKKGEAPVETLRTWVCERNG
jgi:hypothetical protein